MSTHHSATPTTRRNFLTASVGAAAGSLILANTRASGQVNGANDRLRIAVAGANGRGKSHIEGWMGQDNVEIAYVIDPDAKVLQRTLANIEKKVDGPFRCKGVADVREALDDPEVDAISIATPNHWHSLMTIWGAQAGKHVYVEKPMSHDVHEGRVAVEAQKKYGVVIQHGTQRRSDAAIAGLHEAIKAGKWGKLKISYGYCCKPRGTIGFELPKPPANDVDWNLWRGPAVIHQYHDNYVHYDWHWFWSTGNGDMNNQGTHQLDVARWALDDDQTHPVRVMGMGNRFQWQDQGETPNTMFAAAEYPNGQWVYFNVRNVNYEGYERQVENEYYFEDGGRIVRNKYYAVGSDVAEDLNIEPGNVTPGGNWGSFIAACREGKPEMANGTARDAHYGCVLGHLMNNSYRLGQQTAFNENACGFDAGSDTQEHFLKLHHIMRDGVGLSEEKDVYNVGPWLTFDPASESHKGDHAAAANRLLQDVNRKGFEIPDVNKV
ncbi:MAG: putative dehydrogenase [Verrucomicrobiales bacterium]|jgi:predicted dehydrogenase